MRQNLLLLVASIVVTLLVLELGARIWLNYLASPDHYSKYVLYTDIPEDRRQYEPHHYLDYYTRPGYTHGLTRHNSLGFRGREFSVSKPECTSRIVVIGGSTTYTIKVEDNDATFSQQLENILKDDYGYRHVEVINAGVGGYNSWESLINLEFRVLDLQPDLVIVYHGVNDVHTRLVLPAEYRGDNSGRRKQWTDPDIPFWEHSVLLRIIGRKLHLSKQVSLGSFVNADSYRGAGNKLDYEVSISDQMQMLDENPPVFFRRNLVSMIGIARQHGVGIMLATFAHSPETADRGNTPVYERGYKENNAVIREVASVHGVPLFEFADVMKTDGRYWADSVHVNEAGAFLKASLFARFINDQGLIGKDDKRGDSLCGE